MKTAGALLLTALLALQVWSARAIALGGARPILLVALLASSLGVGAIGGVRIVTALLGPVMPVRGRP